MPGRRVQGPGVHGVLGNELSSVAVEPGMCRRGQAADQPQEGATPLIRAARCGNAEMVQFLLEVGADQDAIDDVSSTNHCYPHALNVETLRVPAQGCRMLMCGASWNRNDDCRMIPDAFEFRRTAPMLSSGRLPLATRRRHAYFGWPRPPFARQIAWCSAESEFAPS